MAQYVAQGVRQTGSMFEVICVGPFDAEADAFAPNHKSNGVEMIGVLHGGQIKIGALYLFGRDSAGDLGIAFWHARNSPCWLWSISTQRYREGERRRLIGWTAQHGPQWHRKLHVFRLFKIGFSGQPHSWTRRASEDGSQGT